MNSSPHSWPIAITLQKQAEIEREVLELAQQARNLAAKASALAKKVEQDENDDEMQKRKAARLAKFNDADLFAVLRFMNSNDLGEQEEEVRGYIENLRFQRLEFVAVFKRIEGITQSATGSLEDIAPLLAEARDIDEAFTGYGEFEVTNDMVGTAPAKADPPHI